MKKIISTFVAAGVLCAALFAEHDSGEVFPVGETFNAQQIYIEANGGLVFPLHVFDSDVEDSITKIGAGFGVGAGYNWGGWLFGLEYTRDFFGKMRSKYDSVGFEDIRSNVFALRLRRVLSQNTLSFLPRWLEIVPGISGGLNVFTRDSDVDFGDAFAPFGRLSLELALIPGTDRVAPYVAADYNIFYSDKYFDGLVGHPRAILGVRLYPFGGGLGAAGAAAATKLASVVTTIKPQTGFTPDGDGNNDTVTIKTATKNLKSAPESWKVAVLDQQGGVVRSWTGTGKVPVITWDGTTESGERLFSSETYKIVSTVVPSEADRARLGQDEVVETTTVKTGVLMEEIIPQKQWKIVVNTIYFDANAATFDKLEAAQSAANKETLDSIAAQTLALSEDIKIEIQGYANNVSNTEEENQKELIPLSRDRAEAIKKQLQTRGLKAENLTSVGKGGENPLAAWEDKANWWKNRRVEFIVTK